MILFLYNSRESSRQQRCGVWGIFPPPRLPFSFPCHVCLASCTAAPPAGGGSGAGFSLLRVLVAAEPALTCCRGIRRGKLCQGRWVFGNWAVGGEKPPDLGCRGGCPMAVAGGCEQHMLTLRCVEGSRRVFQGMLGLPPEGCWLSLPPLSVGNRSGAGLAATGRLQHPGVWDGGCDSSQVFISFSTLHGAEFTARVFLVPPCPATAFAVTRFPRLLVFGGAVGKGKSPVCASDKVMNHRSGGTFPGLRVGWPWSPSSTALRGKKQLLQGNGAGEDTLGAPTPPPKAHVLRVEMPFWLPAALPVLRGAGGGVCVLGS